MSVPQNKFQKILYQAQQMIISHIDTSAFQAVQQNEGCMWRPKKNNNATKTLHVLPNTCKTRSKASISVAVLLIS